MPTPNAEGDALVSRTFDSPRERVFRALTAPDELARWYGPASFEAPRERIRVELRVGGRWEIVLRPRDGGDVLLVGYEIEDLEAPRLLAMRSDPLPDLGVEAGSVVRIELFNHGEKTRMTFSDGPLPADKRAVAAQGWGAAFDDLARYLAEGGDRGSRPRGDG